MKNHPDMKLISLKIINLDTKLVITIKAYRDKKTILKMAKTKSANLFRKILLRRWLKDQLFKFTTFSISNY
jgi:hypothetical protein